MSKMAFAKDIVYDFSQCTDFKEAVDAITQKAKKDFLEEKQEFEDLIMNGDITSLEEYQEDFGGSKVDFTKAFEENINFYRAGIDKGVQNYLADKYDIPQSVVVEISDNQFSDKGQPNENALISAIQNGYLPDNIKVQEIKSSREAKSEDIIWQKGYDKMTEMLKSKEYSDFMKLASGLSKYSVDNIARIYAQKPDATLTMGYKAWQELNRSPKTGTALKILAPNSKSLKSEKEVESYVNGKYKRIAKNEKKDISEYKKEMEEEKERLKKMIETKGVAYISSSNTTFNSTNVFDISDTYILDPDKPDKAGEILALEKPLNKDMSNYNEVAECLKKAATLTEFNVKDSTSEQDALYEAIEAYAKKAFEQCPEKIAGVKTYQNSSSWNGSTSKRLVEAEAILTAYLVSNHIGIECNDKATKHLASCLDKLCQEQHISKREAFTNAFNNASKLAQQTEKEFDKEIAKTLGVEYNAPIQFQDFELMYNGMSIEGDLETASFSLGEYTPQGENTPTVSGFMSRLKFAKVEVDIQQAVSFHLDVIKNLDTNDSNVKISALQGDKLFEVPITDQERMELKSHLPELVRKAKEHVTTQEMYEDIEKLMTNLKDDNSKNHKAEAIDLG